MAWSNGGTADEATGALVAETQTVGVGPELEATVPRDAHGFVDSAVQDRVAAERVADSACWAAPTAAASPEAAADEGWLPLAACTATSHS